MAEDLKGRNGLSVKRTRKGKKIKSRGGVERMRNTAAERGKIREAEECDRTERRQRSSEGDGGVNYSKCGGQIKM